MQKPLDRFLVALEFHDKLLVCSDWPEQFVFSASEQALYQHKHLKPEPKRCHNCRILSRLRHDGVDPKQTAEICCVNWGTISRMPLVSRGHKSIYCPTCFHAKKIQKKDSDG